MLYNMLALALLTTIVACYMDATVDGAISVKLSNFSGYDLWFPNGSQRYSLKLYGNYICNGMWYSVPMKQLDIEFDVGGFFLVVFLALCVTAIMTAMIPMMASIAKQHKLSINKSSLNLAFSYFNHVAWLYQAQATTGVDQSAEIERVKKQCEEEHAREESDLRRVAKSSIFAFAWFYICTVFVFLVSVVVMDAFMVANEWPNAQRVTTHGYCYALDKSDMFYTEEETSLTEAYALSQKQSSRLLLSDDDAGSETNFNDTVDEYARATVKLIDKNAVTFVAKCGKKFFRPSIGRNTTFEFVSRYESVCTPVDMRHPVDVKSSIWRGSEPNGGDNKLPEGYWNWYDVYMRNQENRSSVKSGSAWCNYYWLEDKSIYNARFTSCCAPYDAINGIDKFCAGNWSRGDLKNTNIHDTDTTQFLRNNNAEGNFAIKTWEVQVQHLPNWYECRIQDNFEPKVLVNGEVLPEMAILHYESTMDDADILGAFGWEQTKDGKEYIKNNQYTNFDHGLGYSLYWGNDTDAEWLRKHLDRDVTYGWKSPKAKMPRFDSFDTTPPAGISDCQMTFVLDKQYGDLEALNNYCNDTAVYMNSNGMVVFTTSSEDLCGIVINVSVQDEYVSSYIEFDSMHAYTLYADGDMYWRCNTGGVNNSHGTNCDYDTPWHAFTPENYSTTYITRDHSIIYPASGESNGNPSPNPFKNASKILTIVGSAIAAVTGAAAIVAVIIKVVAIAKVSKSAAQAVGFGGGKRETNNYNNNVQQIIINNMGDHNSDDAYDLDYDKKHSVI